MQNLYIQDITKKYGKHTALDQINLEISPGVFGLLGPNGAGKSTLMRLLTTLLPIESGHIQYGEISWNRQNEVRRILGYLPQKFSLYKHMKVHEALTNLALLKGINQNTEEAVQQVIKKVNLESERNKKIGQLSGGMVRRVGIAQAILGSPKLIIVDEPTAGLDPEERIRLRNILQTVGDTATVIISSHIVEDIESLCEQVAVLQRGRILKQGSVAELKKAAQGKIGTVLLEKGEFVQRQQELEIIHQQQKDGRYQLRVLLRGHELPDAIMESEPTLEDAYFYFMKQNEGSTTC